MKYFDGFSAAHSIRVLDLLPVMKKVSTQHNPFSGNCCSVKLEGGESRREVYRVDKTIARRSGGEVGYIVLAVVLRGHERFGVLALFPVPFPISCLFAHLLNIPAFLI